MKKNNVKKRVNISFDLKTYKTLFTIAKSREMLLGSYLKQIILSETKNLKKLSLID